MALLTALSGWAIAALVACTVVLPTLARGKLAVVGFRWTRRVVWLGARYRVGFAIAGATLLHAFLAMSVGRLPAAALAEDSGLHPEAIPPALVNERRM